MAAAERLFAQRGYAGTSIHALAKAARVSKASVFHHFRSKEALYLEVISAAAREFREQLDAMPRGNAVSREHIEAFVVRQLEHMLRRSRVTRLVLREVTEGGAHQSRRLTKGGLGVNFTLLVELLRGAQAAGMVHPNVDCTVAACLLTGANIFFFQALPLLTHLPAIGFKDDAGAYARQVTHQILNGILVRRK
ncbi:MAG: TetR/AcrR family transcriptional regulator [Steroidobacteraceae bacterium]